MGLHHSPKIVTNGLVLALDAGDRNSYTSGSSTWNDLSGNGYNGTLVNGPTFSYDNGGAINFDMSNDHIIVQDNPDLAITGNLLTLEITFKTDFSVTDNHGNALLNRRHSYQTGQSPFYLWHVQGDHITGLIDTSNGRYVVRTSSAPDINDGIPHTVQMVYNGTTLYIYLDGVEVDTTAATGNILYYGELDLLIGAGKVNGNLGSTYYWNGNIYQAKVYNRALTASEVLQNYNALKGRFGLQ